MGEDHQQQRARVAPGAPDTCRPGGEAGGPAGGAALRGEPGLVRRPPFSPEPGSRSLTERAQRACRPGQTQRPGPGAGTTQRHCTPAARGRPPSWPQGPIFSQRAFFSRQNYRVWGGGPSSDLSNELVESSVEFPLGRGHCTLGLVLTGKQIKLNREVFLFWICIFLLMLFCFPFPIFARPAPLFFFVLSQF